VAIFGSRTNSTGVCQRPFWRRDPQMATSGRPSAEPPNQAAISSPGFTSTMVEAWQEAVGIGSAMNSEV